MPDLHKILHVEDDADILRLAKISLERVGGYVVEACESAPKALTQALTFKPDLILLDIMMPEMDGVEAYHAFRRLEQTEQTPVILLTAKADMESLGELAELGSIGVITKPLIPL